MIGTISMRSGFGLHCTGSPCVGEGTDVIHDHGGRRAVGEVHARRQLLQVPVGLHIPSR